MAAHLRREMEEGHLSGLMPGVLKLEAETGANRKTVESALRILERDGLLLPQGAGKRRLIAPQGNAKRTGGLRVGFLDYEREDRGLDYMLSLDRLLTDAGHTVIRAPRALTQLGMHVGKVARLVGETRADAWVALSATREVLAWFVAQDIPVMAMFGRRRELPIASVGPNKQPAYREATRALLELGHRRIVLITRKIRRLPQPGLAEQAFLDELTAHRLTPSTYNLPDWEENVAGFHTCLKSLFGLTPPTAMIADEPQFYFAIRHYLASNGLSVPGDVSLVCTDYDPNFAWCQPLVTHIQWNQQPLITRIAKWVDNIYRGKEDIRHTFIKAEFIPGGTIGRVKPTE